MSGLSEALVAAQRDMPHLTKDAEVKGRQFSYAYLSLQGLLEAVLPVLNSHGLMLMQMPAYWEGIDVLWTHLRHVSGDEVKSPMRIPAPAGATAQEFGSALTYARRYAVLSFLGLAPDEDDDGSKASGAVTRRSNAPGATVPEEPPPEPPSEAAERPLAASERPAAPGTLTALKQAVEGLEKGFPSPDPTFSYWDDVRRYSEAKFNKTDSSAWTEAEAVELVLEFENRLVQAGKEAKVPWN